MKKKGFTLIELLFVIVLLGLLTLLISPNINKLISNSEEKIYRVQVKSIEDSARNFITDYSDSISDLSSFTIELKLLKDFSYVEYDIKNPMTEKYFSDNSLVTFEKQNNNYVVTFHPQDSENISDTTKYLNHIVILKGGNTYSGSDYKLNSNILLLGENGNLYTNGYSVSTSNVSSATNAGYQTVTYTVSLTENTTNYSYTISRDEKSA